MSEQEKPATLWQKLAAANATIPSVLTKDARNDAQNYPYLSETQAVAPIRDALLAHGLVLLVDEPSWPVREPAAPTKQGNEQHAITVCLEATITCTESGERVSFSMFGSAIDRDGRGHASARTDALKGLRQVFALAAEEPTKEDRQRPAAKPLTADDVARKAADLGYTDEQRDFIISAEGEAVPASARALAELQPEHLQAALDVLSDPAALEYAQAHTPTAQPA